MIFVVKVFSDLKCAIKCQDSTLVVLVVFADREKLREEESFQEKPSLVSCWNWRKIKVLMIL